MPAYQLLRYLHFNLQNFLICCFVKEKRLPDLKKVKVPKLRLPWIILVAQSNHESLQVEDETQKNGL